MIVSLNIADVGVARVPSLVSSPPKPRDVAGLRHADIGVTAPLSGSMLKSPTLGRVALIGFWDNERVLDNFIASNSRFDDLFVSGLSARLSPLRAHGTWPGLDNNVPKVRNVDHVGPVVVLTLARLRLSQTPRFFRASAKAEGAAINADGLIWATGIARPPFLSTCSIWDSDTSAQAYAYGHAATAHPSAIASGNQKAFHKQEAFIRFHPSAMSGSLTGKNPLAVL